MHRWSWLLVIAVAVACDATPSYRHKELGAPAFREMLDHESSARQIEVSHIKLGKVKPE
jgi:hypothetical protein